MAKFKDFINNSKGLQTGISIFNTVSDAIPSLDKTINDYDGAIESGRSTVNKMLMSSGNPWAMAAGAVNTIIDKTGGYTDASQGLGKTNDFLNGLTAAVAPGFGWFTPKTKDIGELNDLFASSSGFTGSLANWRDAELNSNAKLMFGRGVANKMITDSQLAQHTATRLLEDNLLAKYNATNPMYTHRNTLQLGGGYDPTVSAKKGTKLYNLDEVKRILACQSGNKPKLEHNHLPSLEEIPSTIKKEVTEFKQGGSINVIPEGALHARKHHLSDTDEKFKDVTPKGIPVITESEGGEITQHAEVEKEEIIFRLEVTEKLEDLAKKGTDEAAIEAGKLLTDEILRNTKDNTNKLI